MFAEFEIVIAHGLEQTLVAIGWHGGAGCHICSGA